jgi:hypothetical protein
LPTDFPKMTSGLGPHLFDADLETAHRRGEFSAQAILVRLDCIDGERRRVVHMPRRDARGAAVHERYERQHEQTSGANADAEQHE